MNKEVSGSEQEEEGEEDVIVMDDDDVKIGSVLKKEKSLRKGKKFGFGDFEMYFSLLSKQLRFKIEVMEIDELNKIVIKDIELQEGLVIF